MSDASFLRKAIRREDEQEREQALYDQLYEQVQAEQMCDWVADGENAWTFRTKGEQIHAEVAKEMNYNKKQLA